MSRTLHIIRAEVMGYCMGVRRAVEAAERALVESPVRPVYTYGPLIHNPQAIHALEEKGVIILGSGFTPLPADFAGASVVIRAHGVPPDERESLQSRNAVFVDATCPRVQASQKQARQWHERGYTVILAGDKNHGEITGIAGYAPLSIVVENARDAAALGEQLSGWPEKAVLISQTTIKESEFDAIAAELTVHIPDLVLLSAICSATQQRQKALETLASSVDGIIVVGGRNSANTLRLFSTAQQLCPHAWHIETPEELPEQAFTLSRIGITAGASTPDSIIDAVEQALQKGYYSRHESN